MNFAPSGRQRELSEELKKEMEKDVLKTFKELKYCRMSRLIKNNPKARTETEADDYILDFDHPSQWVDKKGNVIQIFQPYNIYDRDIKNLLQLCEKYGLDFSISGRSWYFPGQTVLIQVWNKRLFKE